MKTVSYGLGRRIINPTLPVSLAGYFNVRRLTEVFDDIEVRAIVFREGGKQFLLVQFDRSFSTHQLLLLTQVRGLVRAEPTFEHKLV